MDSRIDLIMNRLEENPVDFASKLGVSKEYIYMIQSGARNISKQLANKIQDRFGVPVSFSYDGIGEFDIHSQLIKEEYKEPVDKMLAPHKDVVNHSGIGVPMYNVPGSAGGIELYNDLSSYKSVGHLNFPGATKDSFALPVYGSSMFPTLEDGSWAVLRPINNRFSIIWGEVYYIEYGDYRLYKRLLAGEEDDDVILWSDNQEEKINGKPIYTQIKIKKTEIQRICLVTDKYKKANN